MIKIDHPTDGVNWPDSVMTAPARNSYLRAMDTITTVTDHTITDHPATERSVDDLLRALANGAAERDRTGEISAQVFDDLRVAGLTKMLVPTEFGGGGATFDETGQMLRRLGRHGVPGTEAVFAKVVDGAVLISTGASDWVGSNGTVRAVEGGYRVSARKSPASGCEVGQVLVTSIRWDDAPDGPQVIHCSVPLNADGVHIEPTWNTLGLRATGSHTVVLDDVFVPDAAVSLTRPADRWHPVWNAVVGVALPLIMAPYLGIADAAVEHARAVAARSDQPHTPQLLGELINAHTVARDVVTAMFADADDLDFDNTDDYASRTLSRKTVAADAAIETVRLTLELVGGASYSRSHEVERLLRDVHGCLFHPLPRARQIVLSANVAVGKSPID